MGQVLAIGVAAGMLVLLVVQSNVLRPAAARATAGGGGRPRMSRTIRAGALARPGAAAPVLTSPRAGRQRLARAGPGR